MVIKVSVIEGLHCSFLAWVSMLKWSGGGEVWSMSTWVDKENVEVFFIVFVQAQESCMVASFPLSPLAPMKM